MRNLKWTQSAFVLQLLRIRWKNISVCTWAKWRWGCLWRFQLCFKCKTRFKLDSDKAGVISVITMKCISYEIDDQMSEEERKKWFLSDDFFFFKRNGSFNVLFLSKQSCCCAKKKFIHYNPVKNLQIQKPLYEFKISDMLVYVTLHFEVRDPKFKLDYRNCALHFRLWINMRLFPQQFT